MAGDNEPRRWQFEKRIGPASIMLIVQLFVGTFALGTIWADVRAGNLIAIKTGAKVEIMEKVYAEHNVRVGKLETIIDFLRAEIERLGRATERSTRGMLSLPPSD